MITTEALVCDKPLVTLLIAAIVTGAAIWLTVTKLTFQPDRNALIRQDLEWEGFIV